MIDKNEIIKAIAERHKVIINQEDPILAVFAINDVILEDSLKTLGGIMQKCRDELVAGFQLILERQQGWVRQENESTFKYHGQIMRDAHIRFDRSIDETIDTIKRWYFEVAQMKSSAWMAVTATIVVMVMGFCAAAAVNIWH